MAVDTDVLVVGAGPTGLTLAAELRRHGATVTAVERAPEPSDTSRALAVHARTLEILQRLGVADAAVQRGIRLHGATVMSGPSRLAHASMDELDSPFPFILSLPQSQTERLLATRAVELGATIQRGLELTAFEQDSEGVTATLRRSDGGVEIARARYVVGCDGAHSTVRQLMDLDFDGIDLEGRFCLADVHYDGELPRDEGTAFFSPQGIVLALPLPGDNLWRLIVAPSDDAPIPASPDLAFFETELRRRTNLTGTLFDPLWLSTFVIRQRKVSRYRVHRAFVAGDAAHSHSPVGGQGMNTGIQDAFNLGRKLALVVGGAGRPALLDSYEPEREPIARALLEVTERATRAVTLRNPVSQEIRNRAVQFLLSLEVVQQRLTRRIGELDLNYRASPLVSEVRPSLADLRLLHDDTGNRATVGEYRDFGAGPHAGDRAPDCALDSNPTAARLFDLLDTPAHVALLFCGRSRHGDRDRHLAAMAERIETRFRAPISAHVVVRSEERPEGVGSHSIVLDPRGELHSRYGASAECLYLVRPDGHIGFRSQPADWAELENHLSRSLY